VPLHRAV